MNAKQLVKMLQSSDWGMTQSGGNGEVLVKGNNIVIKDSFYYGGEKALRDKIKDWTDPSGTTAKYFKKEHGITFKVVNKSVEVSGGKMYGKKQKDGVITIELSIDQSKTENKVYTTVSKLNESHEQYIPKIIQALGSNDVVFDKEEYGDDYERLYFKIKRGIIALTPERMKLLQSLPNFMIVLVDLKNKQVLVTFDK